MSARQLLREHIDIHGLVRPPLRNRKKFAANDRSNDVVQLLKSFTKRLLASISENY